LHKGALFLLAVLLHASAIFAQVQRFEPLSDTLAKYDIRTVPDQSAYPNTPAVGILSITEFRQLGLRQERSYHRIVKILTAQGKRYGNVKVPCHESCHIEARTIKPDGRIINVRGSDVIHVQKLSGYQTPYTFAQFALPAVEAGDIIEYAVTNRIDYPLYIEEFGFAENYPVMKSIFILIHPDDYSYAYTQRTVAGMEPFKVQRDQVRDGQTYNVRTTFTASNLQPGLSEPMAPDTRDGEPGIRLLIDGKGMRKLDVFQDWWSFGGFVEENAGPLIDGIKVKSFVTQAIGNNTDPATIVKLVYQAADRKIRIYQELDRGFDFQAPEKTLEKKAAGPYDFAVFLASCFKSLNWGSELVLVNSHSREEASKTAVFPLDLDLVFLNVKTGTAEFLLDCNENGMPANVLPAGSMNRFALGIPLTSGKGMNSMSPYTTQMPYREGNRNHLDLDAVSDSQNWNLTFHWMLTGDYQEPFVRAYRNQGDAEVRKQVSDYLRENLQAMDVKDVNYQFLTNGIQLDGKATLPRRPIRGTLELFQRDFLSSDLDVSSSMLEKRVHSVLLPYAGEVSATFKIHPEAGSHFTVPAAYDLECHPLHYQITFQNQANTIVVDEKLSIRDLLIKPEQFPKMGAFLDQYHQAHSWALLMSPELPAFSPTAPIKVVYATAPAPAPAPKPEATTPKPQLAAKPAAALPAPPAKPAEKANSCKDAATVMIKGTIEYHQANLFVKNLTTDPIESANFTIAFGSYIQGVGGETRNNYEKKEPIAAGQTKTWSFGTDSGFDYVKVYIRFLQKGVWHECGPFWIPHEPEKHD
jgi:Domain of Unknown Function with PDB structure (DUF3857)